VKVLLETQIIGEMFLPARDVLIVIDINVNAKEIIMPYIKEKRRESLDNAIRGMIIAFKTNLEGKTFEKEQLSNEEFLNICGDINYAFSSILGRLMGNVSYVKIAMITGVLENIKQEFYRRVGGCVENQKIIENGDIREYKSFPPPT